LCPHLESDKASVVFPEIKSLNSNFEEKIMPSKFSGDIYFDDINGVLFLDIEKN
jgi:hypothetical protein